MIQRKQSLWFLLSALNACVAFILPFGFKNTTSISSYNIDVHDFTAQSNLILTGLFAAVILLNIAAVFMYKNRDMQINLSLFSILLCAGILAYEIYYSTLDGNSISIGFVNATLYAGLIIPVISMVFTGLAMKGVKNDIKLLRETNRLR